MTPAEFPCDAIVNIRAAIRGLSFLTAFLAVSGSAFAQTRPAPPPPPNPPSAGGRSVAVDPGVREGNGDAGGPLDGLTTDEWQFFTAALARFQEVSSVSGAIANEQGVGLGPRFNHNSCAACHAYPATGGSSAPINTQVNVATLDGALNTVPPFITRNGPVREARFVRNADGTPDGGVHDLFVISGRSDAPSCNVVQPDFATAIANNNVVFRIPTPMFGLGLVENTPDDHLVAAAAANADLKTTLGVAGTFNHSANDGTITRFGWKAQNKSLTVFAGEAYNVEQGVTNEAFPNERETDTHCQFNATPEDKTTLSHVANTTSPASAYASDIVNFATLSRLLAPPAPAPSTQQTVRGAQVFTTVGCHLCHVATQTTGPSVTEGLNNVSYHPFSDFALHDMGQGLADGVTQGNANGREWRTAPLWGLGQRLFFLHDGRTSDLVQAIGAHAGQGSEANGVIAQFNQLSAQDAAALMAFLRSL